MNLRAITTALVVAVLLGSCAGNEGPATDAFDRPAMLRGLADGVIIPSYDSADVAFRELSEAVDQLPDANLTAVDIERVQTGYVRAARAWQRIVTFNFGPAEDDLGTLAQELATFPCDTSEVEQRVQRSDTALRDFRRDTRGLATVDYLLFARERAATADVFGGAAGAARRAYLRAVVRRMSSEVSAVVTAWKSTYRDVFISRSGTDAGSSVSLLFNEFNKSFELLKNFKLGLPLGLRAGQTTSEPTKVEAYHSGLSLELLREHYTSIRDLWKGASRSGSSVPSFRDYLLTVVNGPRLVQDTEAQLARVDAAFDRLGSGPLSQQIVANPQSLIELHTELQKLTRFIKSEMSSLLGISITYSSGDGD
jgi:predicted lipoprotein